MITRVSQTLRGWSSGEPSSVINFINQKKIANPIFLLDEIEKAGGSSHTGKIHDTLLNLFEPSSACAVYDDYLAAHADLSNITWLYSANEVSQMPTTLLSGLEVITVEKPKAEHYPQIIKKSIAEAKNLRKVTSSSYLICNRKGQPYTSNGFKSLWQKTMVAALSKGIISERFTFRDLRPKAASDHEDGTKLLAHADPKTKESQKK